MRSAAAAHRALHNVTSRKHIQQPSTLFCYSRLTTTAGSWRQHQHSFSSGTVPTTNPSAGPYISRTPGASSTVPSENPSASPNIWRRNQSSIASSPASLSYSQPSQQSQLQQQHYLSSLATAVRTEADAEEEEDDELQNTIETSHEFSNSNHRRPRLLALRKQLEHDKFQLLTMSKPNNSISVQVTTTQTTKKKSNKQAAQSLESTSKSQLSKDNTQQEQQQPKENTKKSLEDWQRFIARLADPTPTPTTTTADAVSSSASYLTDRFQRHHNYLRLSLTEKCNFRCTYCMPLEGVPLSPSSELLQTNELLQLAQVFALGGVTKFRLTGGEPTLRNDLTDILRGLKAIHINQKKKNSQELGYTDSEYAEATNTDSIIQKPSIGMTTNGLTLWKNLDEYRQAGLDSVNISLDTLDKVKFAQVTRRPATYFDHVWKSLEAANDMAASESAAAAAAAVTSTIAAAAAAQTTTTPIFSVKLNCVVMRGFNDMEVADFVKLTERFPFVQVRFIEYMPFTKNGWNTDRFISYQELLQTLQTNDNLVLDNVLPVRDPHDTTKWYHHHHHHHSHSMNMINNNHSQHVHANIGFITSMSNNFCGGCNRLRLSARGQIKVCLFQDETSEEDDDDDNKKSMDRDVLDLKSALRAGCHEKELLKLAWAALQTKHARLGGHKDAQEINQGAENNRPMTLIGG